MNQIKPCPFCERSIPDISAFCCYCGKDVRRVEQPKLKKTNLDLQKSIGKLKKQAISFISNLETKVENSTSLSYVNKQRVLNILNQFQYKEKGELEGDPEELSEWVKKVEEAISGEKCIICLQEFVIKEKEQLNVILCPHCNYAGHPNHFITWLDTRKKCPMCRSDLDKDSLLRGYLSEKDEKLVFTSEP